MSTQNPVKAYHFLAPAVIGGPSDDALAVKPRSFTGVAYSGDVITDHWMFRRVVFDLSTTTCDTPAPLLLGHDQEDTIGVITEASILDQLEIAGTLFSSIDDDAADVAAKADAGFPWQLSVGIFPGSIEEVPAGVSVTVNGRLQDGPFSIFRNSRIREVSFCALGADRQTSATVFSTEGGSVPTNEETLMNEQEPDNGKAVIDGLKAKLDEAQTKITELEGQIAQFHTEKRTVEVKALFSTLGREVADEAIAPYLTMSNTQFAAVANDMMAMKPKPANHLFSAAPAGSGDEAKIDPAAINREIMNQVRGK